MTALRAACEGGADSLFSRSADELLRLVAHEFPDELARLKRAYSLRTGGPAPSSASASGLPRPASPSQLLFGADYDEVNRTLTSVLALKWLHEGDYATFTGGQPGGPELRLSRAGFGWLREFCCGGDDALLDGPDDLYALLLSLVVNDLGKDPQLARDVARATGGGEEDDEHEDVSVVSALNHDAILLRAVRAGLVACLDRLPPRQRADLVRGIELCAEFNFGQLAQAENAPACLASLSRVMGGGGGGSHQQQQQHPRRAFALRFAEQLLDLAGASGHMDWTCARLLVQPVFEAYRGVYDVASGVIAGGGGGGRFPSLRAAYDVILCRRAELLRRTAGFRPLDVAGGGADRALARLLCMGGVADLPTARLYDEVWDSLGEEGGGDVRRSLAASLNTDGSAAAPAVQPTYMPALLAQALGAMDPDAPDRRAAALASALRYLARVMADPRGEWGEEEMAGPVSVVERDVMRVVKEVVKTPEFRADPRILETAPVPRGVPANFERPE
ncbi:hypothetical protein GGR56DRAFT_667398 [Xylariaceae sp. FL0804]|nr:hypothetical protein GGR56DRAFT_667398 [Xylariaceae sp. FL0804]